MPFAGALSMLLSMVLLISGCNVTGGAGCGRGDPAVISPPACDRITRLEFERSGGLFALGRQPDALIELRPDSGTATSSFAGTRRELTSDELELFHRLSACELRKLQLIHGEHAADRYEYAVKITTACGEPVRLTLREEDRGEDLDRRSAGLGALKEWIVSEAQRIWQQRTSSTSNGLKSP